MAKFFFIFLLQFGNNAVCDDLSPQILVVPSTPCPVSAGAVEKSAVSEYLKQWKDASSLELLSSPATVSLSVN